MWPPGDVRLTRCQSSQNMLRLSSAKCETLKDCQGLGSHSRSKFWANSPVRRLSEGVRISVSKCPFLLATNFHFFVLIPILVRMWVGASGMRREASEFQHALLARSCKERFLQFAEKWQKLGLFDLLIVSGKIHLQVNVSQFEPNIGRQDSKPAGRSCMLSVVRWHCAGHNSLAKQSCNCF